jgi:dipeptidyl aminopeptidase/acylaminoacyl peptidase
MKKAVTFYSEGRKLAGDLYLPSDLRQGEKRAGVLLCHGYTGVKDLYLPDNARVLTEAGYVVMTFDYKGWGTSEGPRARLNPHGRVTDAHAALTFLAMRAEVDDDRLGVYGTSYGGGTAIWLAAIDARAKCVVSVVGVGHGARWMRSVRRPDEWRDLLEKSQADRARRVTTGESAVVDRDVVLLPDRQSKELTAAARRANPAAVNEVPLEYVDETLSFNPEWVVGKIAPRAVLIITTDDDRLVPPEQSIAMYEQAGEPKKLVILPNYGHYEVYAEPAFSEVMNETLDWLGRFVPAGN